MSEIKLAGKLPKGDQNGLGAIARSLIHHPDRFKVVLAVVDCETITTHADTGEVVPTARIRRVEVVLDADLQTARGMVLRSLQDRMGHDANALPLDFEYELGDLAEAFTGNTFLREVR